MNTRIRRELDPHELEECRKLNAIYQLRKAEAKADGRNLTQSDIGDACGWASGQSVFNQLVNGRLALNVDNLIKLSKALNFAPSEVSPRLAKTIDQIAEMSDQVKNSNGTAMMVKLGASGDYGLLRLAETTSEESNVGGVYAAHKPHRIPVVGKAMLGHDGFFEALDYPPGHGDGFLEIYSSDAEAYGLRVVGNSMMPRIKNNEFVLIEPGREFVSGDEVLVRTRSGQAMIKEFIYHRDGQYRFDSVNKDFEPFFVPDEDILSVQYVAAIIKSSRFIAN
ncbi:LexA family transcriptional regulator [Pseudomonas petrae]|uniref:Helix-turn-helix transcriptional regulator n=1 Tax=Pseudomonas petrae TaxID=2912190 RepID=A0ABS9I0D7_9PSED|nr:helix-turn-helix transcriptional regulator [Pseudomonas petrae]MCF7540616.1 helix-turn-helix transcriptional regulator [Pseudomonas petrae]